MSIFKETHISNQQNKTQQRRGKEYRNEERALREDLINGRLVLRIEHLHGRTKLLLHSYIKRKRTERKGGLGKNSVKQEKKRRGERGR